MTSTTTEPRTRDRILEVALEQFAVRGFDATSMRQIAEELGITKAALYYHFSSKDEIVRTLLTEIDSHTEELVVWAQQQEVTPALRKRVLERWATIMQAHGLTAFRFVMANREVVNRIRGNDRGVLPSLTALYDLLAPADATVADQLRIRLALVSINLAGFVGAGIDAPESEILAAARDLAAELMAGTQA